MQIFNNYTKISEPKKKQWFIPNPIKISVFALIIIGLSLFKSDYSNSKVHEAASNKFKITKPAVKNLIQIQKVAKTDSLLKIRLDH